MGSSKAGGDYDNRIQDTARHCAYCGKKMYYTQTAIRQRNATTGKFFCCNEHQRAYATPKMEFDMNHVWLARIWNNPEVDPVFPDTPVRKEVKPYEFALYPPAPSEDSE